MPIATEHLQCPPVRLTRAHSSVAGSRYAALRKIKCPSNGVLENQKQSQRRAVKRKRKARDEAVNAGQVSYPRATGAGGGNSSVLALDDWQHPYANWAPNTMSNILISAPALHHGAAPRLATQIFEHTPSVIAPAVPLPRGGGRDLAFAFHVLHVATVMRCRYAGGALSLPCTTSSEASIVFFVYIARREGKFEACGGGHIVLKPPT